MERDKQEEQGMPRERKLSTDARTHVRTVQVLADSLLADNLFLAEMKASSGATNGHGPEGAYCASRAKWRTASVHSSLVPRWLGHRIMWHLRPSRLLQ